MSVNERPKLQLTNEKLSFMEDLAVEIPRQPSDVDC